MRPQGWAFYLPIISMAVSLLKLDRIPFSQQFVTDSLSLASSKQINIRCRRILDTFGYPHMINMVNRKQHTPSPIEPCFFWYAVWKVAYADAHIRKIPTRAHAQVFFDRTWGSQPPAAQPTQSCLRLKINRFLREEPTPPTLRCKTHMIGLRNMSCSSLYLDFMISKTRMLRLLRFMKFGLPHTSTYHFQRNIRYPSTPSPVGHLCEGPIWFILTGGWGLIRRVDHGEIMTMLSEIIQGKSWGKWIWSSTMAA
jgi:hypothetical protein